jgi:hypothetical protein
MLYFIQSGHRIKIGRGNALSRYRTINTASPDPCQLLLAIQVRDESGAEKALHRHFRERRRNGEWFEITFSAACRALVDLRIMPDQEGEEPDHAPLGIPPVHRTFADWFLVTHAHDWTAEAIREARHHIDRHWRRHHAEFLRWLKKYDSEVDQMIRMAQPMSIADATAFRAAMRRRLLQP